MELLLLKDCHSTLALKMAQLLGGQAPCWFVYGSTHRLAKRCEMMGVMLLLSLYSCCSEPGRLGGDAQSEPLFSAGDSILC